MSIQKKYYVYVLTNKNLNVVYTGVTNTLVRRIYAHKNKLYKEFTQKYNVDRLIYYEIYIDIYQAIKREKEIKGWSRKKKNLLINQKNPAWKDLSGEIF